MTETPEQLRQRIDKGETRDKVDFPDPAAVPLTADAEAAGFPPDRQELALEANALPRGGTGRAPAADPRPTRSIFPLRYVLIAAGILVVALLVMMAALRPGP
ncbi:hypothetical protein SAMN02983003_2230 [Devosia enhydra]|uniref:Uncharacterized protein n=1 Tax=Devosia enhydra TaxID=665118 RepID=A0A1K2HYC3_9HYPH|nr:hypothetical protein [Devosia enhydra]SFZ84819.1 hypothetical protein SAMN02983003_2230 [Devosia enhydra]